MTKPLDPKEELCKKITIEVRDRRLSGEIISDSKVLDMYPDLCDRLSVHLERLRQIESAKQRSNLPSLEQMEVLQSDHSHALPSSEVVDALLKDSSGSRFMLEASSPKQRNAFGVPSLPQSLDDKDHGFPQEESDFRVTFRQSSVSDSEGTMVASGDDSAMEAIPSPTSRYRPTLRPPMPILHLLSDDQNFLINYALSGERFIIGRVSGDLVIPHDLSISSKHLEIQRRRENLAYQWHLVDLKSTNGTFVRVHSADLRHNDMLQIGKERYRFVNQGKEIGLRHVSQNLRGEIWGFQGKEIRVGRNSQDLTPCKDDPFVEPLHAFFRQKSAKGWTVYDNNSLNGTWLRVRTAILHDKFEFQIGEQRFRVSIPSSLNPRTSLNGDPGISPGNKP
jgi:pSer/pThr/pTyr-binding forkhead associated (FHA) protein